MEIKYSKEAVKSIKRIPNPYKEKIKTAIYNIPNGNIKKLIGYDKVFRLRVNDYRILYEQHSAYFYILDILPRGEAYKKL